MSNLGKIFIYEKKTQDIDRYKELFETSGFFTFSTDNLYWLTQYTKEINPDIVIINLPSFIKLNNDTFTELEELLCYAKSCPEVYINYKLPQEHKSQIHQWNFESENLNYEQIFKILKHYNKLN
ncbi:MAG: hypothetical protein IJ019_04985 [Alphaproteobacteria bacterium]|nr:hypothetical protein [Alphaproteobacteria bacterium]